MLFNSLPFIAFAISFFALYFFLPLRLQLAWTLAFSYLFYGWWDWRFLGLLIGSTVFNCLIALKISPSGSEVRSKRWLTIGIVSSLALLFVFKYFNFFADSLHAALASMGLSVSLNELNVVLPIGISFYTFHAINYLIDVYRGKITVERSLLKYGVYIALWPQLVAGPIVRASRLLPQLQQKRPFKWANVQLGLEFVVLGFFLKVVVADSLSPIVDASFARVESLSALNLAIGALFFSFQIYGDFAGYSLIAIGFGRIMGLNLGVNFRRPYLSTSFSEFWTRWHISLSRWLRDYLYISLGGNRKGKGREHFNLMATMVLGGLWHGASWTFVIWGAMHGAYLSLQRLLGKTFSLKQASALAIPSRIVKTLGVFLGVTLTWIFFRATDFPQAFAYVQGLFGDDWSFDTLHNKVEIVIGLVLISALVMAEVFVEYSPQYHTLRRNRYLRTAVVTLIAALIPLLGNFHGSSFIYFQF